MQQDIEKMLALVGIMFVSMLVGVWIGYLIYGDDTADGIREQAKLDEQALEREQERIRDTQSLIRSLDLEVVFSERKADRMCKQWKNDAISYMNATHAIEDKLFECVEMTCAVGDPRDCEESFGLYMNRENNELMPSEAERLEELSLLDDGSKR